jgi:hypothetical protein
MYNSILIEIGTLKDGRPNFSRGDNKLRLITDRHNSQKEICPVQKNYTLLRGPCPGGNWKKLK